MGCDFQSPFLEFLYLLSETFLSANSTFVQTGLPPVNSNKGVPNGLTSPRRSTQYNRSPDRRFISNSSGGTGPRAPQTQAPNVNSNSRASIKSNSQQSIIYNTARLTSETNRSTSERNYDSGVFSDEENDTRKGISDRVTKAASSSMPQNSSITNRGAKNANISAEYLNNKRKKSFLSVTIGM